MQITTPTLVEIPVTPHDALEFLAQHWKQEWALVYGAPVLVLDTIIILGILTYLLNRAYFRSTISGLRANIGSLEAHKEFLADKLADVERQAGVLSRELPTEFKDKIQHLEESLQEMLERTPRTITDQQRDKFRKAIEGVTVNQTISIFCNTIDPECESFARLLAQMFRDSGLQAGFGHSQENLPSDKGLLLVVADTAHVTAEQQKLSTALSDSGIAHRVVQNPRNIPPTVEFYYFVVGKEPKETKVL
jgi:hypothetical protein